MQLVDGVGGVLGVEVDDDCVDHDLFFLVCVVGSLALEVVGEGTVGRRKRSEAKRGGGEGKSVGR